MIRRIAVLMAVLTLASATSALAATADSCTLVGAGAEYRDQRADPGAVDGPSDLCELLSS